MEDEYEWMDCTPLILAARDICRRVVEGESGEPVTALGAAARAWLVRLKEFAPDLDEEVIDEEILDRSLPIEPLPTRLEETNG